MDVGDTVVVSLYQGLRRPRRFIGRGRIKSINEFEISGAHYSWEDPNMTHRLMFVVDLTGGGCGTYFENEVELA